MKSEVLKKAQQALADFLKQRPHLIPYQKEVDRRLSKAPTFKNRVEILQFMTAERLDALGKEVAKLPKAVEKELSVQMKEVQKIEEKGT